MNYVKMITLLLIVNYFPIHSATETCLLPPCPPPPTEAEIKAVENIFVKVRYILGAAFDVQNRKYSKPYKDIPDFVAKTKSLKEDIKTLQLQAKKLNSQAGGLHIYTALLDIELCVSFSTSNLTHCSQALRELKNYLWWKKFDDNWSSYPIMKNWNGFH